MSPLLPIAYSLVGGLVGCVLIVVISKALGHHWLQKEEDYYGEDES